jgi:hypothetical protein
MISAITSGLVMASGLLGTATMASAQVLYQQTFNGEAAGTSQGPLSDVGWSASGVVGWSGIYNNRTGSPTDAATSLPIPGENAVGYAGAGGGTLGYLAIYTTAASGISFSLNPTLNFSVYLQEEQAGSTGPGYFIVQNGGSWYASVLGVTPPTAVDPTGSFGSFNQVSQNLSGAAANWVNVSGIGSGTITLGAAAGADLTGDITGVGFIENLTSAATGGWNYTDYQVSAIANQLVNPGFENGSAGWTSQGNAPTCSTGSTYYNYGGGGGGPCGAPAGSFPIIMHTGTNCAQLWGGGAGYTSYWQQTLFTVPGATWSASGYAYTSTYDVATNASFNVDVAFLDANKVVLAEYQSGVVTNVQCGGPSEDTWLYLPVTNQVQNGVVIGTVPTGILTAPAGTVSVRYQDQFYAGTNTGGSAFWDDAALYLISGPVLVAPAITNLNPSYTYFSTNAQLTFTVVGGNGANITNVQIVATMTGLPGLNAGTNVVTYGPGSPGLNLIGLGTPNVNVSLALSSNTLYSVTINITDNNNVTVQTADVFDTVQPVVELEAGDFNYNGGAWATGGGMFAYANQVGVVGIDEQFAATGRTGGPYRPSDQVNFQHLGEVLPNSNLAYTPQNFVNYWAANPGTSTDQNFEPTCVGWLTPGDWLNYTRNFPTGKYNVFCRIATGANGAQASLQRVLSDPTQTGQSVTNYGTFSIQGLGWNVCSYSPLLDSFGNLASISLGGTQTLRLQVPQGGNPNLVDFLILPAAAAQNPVLLSLYPDGIHPFEPTNKLVFTVGQGSGSAIPAGNVHLVLNGADVTSQVAFTSTGSGWTGVVPITTNAIYAAVINVTNSTSLGSTYSRNFDTFSEGNYQWEAEDFDFNGGSYIDNPVPSGDNVSAGGYHTGELLTNSYFLYPGGDINNAAISGVDFSNSVSGPPTDYRPVDIFGTQVTGDYLRQKFLNAQTNLNDPHVADFNIGFFNPGMWANYTRSYPAGSYNVYARVGCGQSGYTNAPLNVVTGGQGTPNQTTNLLGVFSDWNHVNDWQTYGWVPLRDGNGKLVTVPFTGSPTTLKLGCASSGSINVNFLMLVPAAAPLLTPVLSITQAGSHVTIGFATQANHVYTVSYTSSLSAPIAWSTLTVINGNGAVQTATDTISGSARYYRVLAQ